ncbi:MAG: TIGR02281 family clan AA aspartic protease [Gammaproteobacteria bacterium]|jgi:aspartyl protease family protein
MVIAAWVILLLLLTVFFNDRLDRQNNPNRQLATVTSDGPPEVRLQRNRHGHYVASGLINGQAVEFMLDTGASDVSIPASIAEKLGLERGRAMTYQTANGVITAWQTTVDAIQLGPLQLGPVRASINPNDSSGAVLLGMSFLRHLDFSQQGNILTLKYPTREMH